METDRALYLSQRVEELARRGQVESAAYPDFFNPMFAALKAAHPDVQVVKKTGVGSLYQIVFLPKARRAVVAKLKRDLAEFERDTKNTRAALTQLGEQP